MARYDNRERQAERLPYQGDQAQDAGPQGDEDGGEHGQQAQLARGGGKVRQYQGGGRARGGRGPVQGGGYRGGHQGQGKARGDQNYRGPRKDYRNNGYKTYPDQRRRDNAYRGGRGEGDDVRSGTWRRPNMNNFNRINYNYSTQNQGNIPVLTSSTSNTAAAGNSSHGGWNDWDNWNNYEDCDDGNDGYQQDHGDNQDQSWNYPPNNHYDPPNRKPYQCDVDDGGKRKNQTKLNGKDSKKAKVENEPKK